MRWVFPFVVAFLMAVSVPFASPLDADTIFSVKPGGEFKCVYVSLPQDLGLSYLDSEAETVIEVDRGQSPWADMTYNKVVMKPGVINKNPVCFSYSGREEGEFSFYNIRMSSTDLGISNSISGGLCVSDYDDVDTGVNVTDTTDVCRLLNDNADIIDLTFSEDVTQANPGEVVEKTVYVTSYANLRIRLSIATNLQNDLGDIVVTTSPSKPMVKKTFKVGAPEREGEFDMIAMAQADGCNLQACKKQEKTSLSVTTNEKEGFSAAVAPDNINLKEAVDVLFRLIISNYEEGQEFSVEVSSEPSAEIDPETKTFSVEKDDEKTVVFKVTPGSEDLYKVEFKITTEKSEKLLTAYISIGELLTDAYRYAEDVERTSTPDIREQIRRAREEYEDEYETLSYGEDIDEYGDFRETLDELSETPPTNTRVPVEPGPEPAGFDLLFLFVPIIIVVVVVLLFVAYKKSRVTGSGGYSSYSGYR